MKKMQMSFVSIAFIAFCFALASCSDGSTKPKNLDKPTTDWDKFSYSAGFQTGTQIRQDSLTTKVNFDYMLKGLYDGLQGKDSMMTQEELIAAMSVIQELMMNKQMLQMLNEKRPIPTEHLQGEDKMVYDQGVTFLENNKKNKPNLKILPSGVQIEVRKEGTGNKPKTTQFVMCHIIASLTTGETFQNSIERGQPDVFPVGQVIPGLALSLLEMKEGSEFVAYIPTEKGFAEFPINDKIPQFAALIFDVEFIKILSKEEAEEFQKKQAGPMGQAPPPMGR